jgi:hypothetical protein
MDSPRSFIPRFVREALPKAVDGYNRSRFTHNRLILTPREGHAEDQLWSMRGYHFLDDPRFLRAYARAVQATGFDYAVRWRVHVILWAAEQASRAEGAFVECGTGRGLMASAICEYLDWTDRSFYLYDTFRPFFPADDGSQDGGERMGHYADAAQAVAENFAEWPGVQLVVGRVPDTLLDTAPVAFLHVDLNSAAAEEAAVRHFWPRLSRHAVMVFDDYDHPLYPAERQAARRLAHELGFSVLSVPTGQGIVIR